VAPLPAAFNFAFVSVAKTLKVVLGLNPTEALGIDGIPVSVLKRGFEVLASPIAYLCNRSMATGKVPAGLKMGIVHPVHKGSGKKHADPSPSYHCCPRCWRRWSRSACGST
jgi:hypothetical protein